MTKAIQNKTLQDYLKDSDILIAALDYQGDASW